MVFFADTLTPFLISCLHRQHKEPEAQSRPEPDNIFVTWTKTSLANLKGFAKTCQSVNYLLCQCLLDILNADSDKPQAEFLCNALPN